MCSCYLTAGRNTICIGRERRNNNQSAFSSSACCNPPPQNRRDLQWNFSKRKFNETISLYRQLNYGCFEISRSRHADSSVVSWALAWVPPRFISGVLNTAVWIRLGFQLRWWILSQCEGLVVLGPAQLRDWVRELMLSVLSLPGQNIKTLLVGVFCLTGSTIVILSIWMNC